jgi:dTDP-4-dehydrorhamnose reductase
MAKYLITGANGLLGSEIAKNEYFKDSIALSHKEFDLTNIDMMEKIVKKESPDFIINCAAYTNVTKAEEDYQTAYAVNAIGVKNLAELSKKYNIFLVHFSTDYIFKGDYPENKEYSETDNPNPVNLYGKSKLEGEKFLLNSLKDFLIIRISFLFGLNGKNFVSSVFDLILNRDNLKIVCDQFGKSTYTEDLIIGLKNLLNLKQKGIYHFTNKGRHNRYEFAVEMFEIMKKKFNLKTKIDPIPAVYFPDKTPRPSNSVLSISKYEKITGLKIPTWQNALIRYVERKIKQNNL